MSPARRLLNRFSTLRSTGKFRSSSRGASTEILNSSSNGLSNKTTSEHSLNVISTKTTRTLDPPSGVPIGAQSETDLRFVTSRDSHRSVPLNEPFGFSEKSPRAFMSENDLSSGTADFPEVNRTPSYLRISCALNGYTRSPKADLTPKAPTVLGESLVERRTRMFSQPQERKAAPGFDSPLKTIQTSESKTSEIECLTPVAPLHNNRLNTLLQNEMGNHVSTPGPIRDLISKFDQLDLCGSHKNEKEGVENIEPHKFIINQQPLFDEIDLKKDANGNEEEKETEEPNLKISTDVESDSGISGSSPASSKRNAEILKDTKEEEEDQQEVTTSTPSDGHEFKSLHDKVKSELQAKMDAANKDLENADDYPEKCADSLRAAHGNAHLLVRKKFSKFNELIEKNLNPIPNDPMPVTVQDLEGFWMTITMELTGIQKEFTKVERYRAANWDPSAVEEEEEPVVNTTVAATKPRPLTAKKIAPVVSEETKKKLAEQKALAEQRRAEMRAQMRQKMKAKAQEEPVLGASEEC
uniref:Disks large-associated protein 5 n=1 Tax=Caenorhabditis tropicalis TaxID=1561998 RepID=A0A1I7U548_9PELO